MNYRFLWLAPLLALAACNRTGDDFLPPAYHPASPLAQAGLALPASQALASEPVQAQARPAADQQDAPAHQPAPATPGGGHGHHQH